MDPLRPEQAIRATIVEQLDRFRRALVQRSSSPLSQATAPLWHDGLPEDLIPIQSGVVDFQRVGMRPLRLWRSGSIQGRKAVNRKALRAVPFWSRVQHGPQWRRPQPAAVHDRRSKWVLLEVIR